MEELRGNLHVHSDRSDGTLPLEDIARTAADCKLDFVGINDHHVVCGKNRYLSNVLLLMGTELNSAHSHYLAYNTNVCLDKKQVDGARVISAVKDSGGMGIIAHPFEKGSPIVSRGKHYSWQDWNIQGFDGIEVWNQTSQWRDAATSYARALFMWLFDRYRPFYQGACRKALAKWDELCQTRHVSALAGSDLHGPVLRVLGLKFKILDYPMLFSAVNNYVLVENKTNCAEQDSAMLINALTRGNSWFALDRLGLAYGFSFSACAGCRKAGMGDALLLEKGNVTLHVYSPRKGKITILHNGKPVKNAVNKKNLEFSTPDSGGYRVEVRLKRKGTWLPWLYSNPIYIKKGE